MDGFTQSDELVYTLCDESGRILPSEFAQTLMESVAVVSKQPYRDCPFDSELEVELNRNVSELVQKMERCGQRLFEEETVKIDRYASDLQLALDLEIRRLNKRLKVLDESLKKPLSLKEKLEIQQQKSALKLDLNEKNRSLLARQDELQFKQDQLVEQLQAHISGTKSCILSAFMIEWNLFSSIMDDSPHLTTNSGQTTK